MDGMAVVGLDLAKNVFQVHGVAGDGTVVVRWLLARKKAKAVAVALGPQDGADCLGADDEAGSLSAPRGMRDRLRRHSRRGRGGESVET